MKGMIFLIKKIKIIFLAIFMIIVTSCLSQVNATEINIDSQYQTDIELKDAIKRSNYNLLLSGNSTLEDSFNLKDNVTIKVKNQKKSGSCWAFAFSTILETSISQKYNKTVNEYSPMHIEYVTTQMFNRTLGSGAGSRLATAYCVTGHGPVEETQMPFDSVYDETTGTLKSIEEVGSLDKTVASRLKDTREFANIYKKINNNVVEYYSDSTYSNTYTADEVDVARNVVKEHVKTYGAISADMYMDETNYYNSSTAAYNYNDYENKQKPNHAIAIVGWDDNYSADNFKEGTKPTSNGAYIVLNSYGSEWGQDGYMYISYEDACIEEQLIGITDIEEYVNGAKDYDKSYQHDELGMNLGIKLANNTSLYAANKYTREVPTDKEEYINEVSLYIATTSGVEIYINPNSDDIDAAQLVAVPEKALESGYHTIKLSSPIKLTGDKFAIKVKYTNQEGAQLPLSANLKEFGIEEDTSEFFDNATTQEGESFILMTSSANGEQWEDLYNLKITSNGVTYSFKNSSTCIEAFTTYQEKTSENIAVTGIKLDKTQTTMTVGETGTLVATITPENATNKNISWTTSDENVATVSDTGIITAISEGTATITAITEDGNKTASCTVNVVAKTNTDDDIYKDIDDENNGNNSISTSTTITNNSSNSSDYTVSNKIIPYAGNGILMIIGVILFAVIAVALFIKFRSFKDVK